MPSSERPDKELVMLGQTLRRLRLKKGLSQERLAELAELHRNHVGLIENGRRNLTVKNLLKLARALEVSPGRLLAKF